MRWKLNRFDHAMLDYTIAVMFCQQKFRNIKIFNLLGMFKSKSLNDAYYNTTSVGKLQEILVFSYGYLIT